MLADAAARAGMQREAVAAFLAGTALETEVRSEIREWVGKHRISGVPFFIVGGKVKLSGAQDPRVLVEAIEEAVDAGGA